MRVVKVLGVRLTTKDLSACSGTTGDVFTLGITILLRTYVRTLYRTYTCTVYADIAHLCIVYHHMQLLSQDHEMKTEKTRKSESKP